MDRRHAPTKAQSSSLAAKMYEKIAFSGCWNPRTIETDKVESRSVTLRDSLLRHRNTIYSVPQQWAFAEPQRISPARFASCIVQCIAGVRARKPPHSRKTAKDMAVTAA